MEACVIKSYQGLTPSEVMMETQRILLAPGVATNALLLMVFRWIGGSVKRGGLRNPDGVEKARALIGILLKSAHMRPFRIDLQF